MLAIVEILLKVLLKGSVMKGSCSSIEEDFESGLQKWILRMNCISANLPAIL